MLSAQFAAVAPAPASSTLKHPPFKASGTAGKRTGEAKRIAFSPVSPIPKACLAAASNSGAYGGNGSDEEERSGLIRLRPEVMPKHVAIFLDGYGGLPVQQGYGAGSVNLTRVISECCELGIKTLTVSTFSDDDWKRKELEIDFLMKAHEDYIRSDVKELVTRYNIQYSVIGEKSRLSQRLQETIRWAEEMSQGNKGMHFITAMSYGGRNDIVEATKRLAKKVEDMIVGVEEVDERVFEEEMMMSKLMQSSQTQIY